MSLKRLKFHNIMLHFAPLPIYVRYEKAEVAAVFVMCCVSSEISDM